MSKVKKLITSKEICESDTRLWMVKVPSKVKETITPQIKMIVIYRIKSDLNFTFLKSNLKWYLINNTTQINRIEFMRRSPNDLKIKLAPEIEGLNNSKLFKSMGNGKA